MQAVLCRYFCKQEQRQGQCSLSFGFRAVRAPEKGGTVNGSTHTHTGGWFTWPEHKLVLGRGKVGVGLRTGPHRGRGAGATGFHQDWDLPDKRKQTGCLQGNDCK